MAEPMPSGRWGDRHDPLCARLRPASTTFESWFQNSAAYDQQAKRSLVSCPVCGSAKVEKAIMAPALAPARRSGTPRRADRGSRPPTRRQPPTSHGAGGDDVAAGAGVSRQAEGTARSLTKNADNVGKKFPEEARKMHYGEIEHRSIYGEASPQDAKELHEEGIEFHRCRCCRTSGIRPLRPSIVTLS